MCRLSAIDADNTTLKHMSHQNCMINVTCVKGCLGLACLFLCENGGPNSHKVHTMYFINRPSFEYSN